jgi:Protein of unknown function (DUF3987)
MQAVSDQYRNLQMSILYGAAPDDGARGCEPTSLDLPLAVTFFDSFGAKSAKRETVSLHGLMPLLQNTTADSKKSLPWIKLAEFGNVRTDKGSLRHDANVLSISGIAADYDGEIVSLDDAAAMLALAGLAAVLYTSPSHADEKPRWRVTCPLSKPLPPTEHAALIGRLNGALNGILAGESWTLSQSYYAGSVNSNPAHRVVAVDGRFLDLATELPEVAKRGKPAPAATGNDPAPMPDEGPDDDALIDDLRSGASYHEPLRGLAARHIGRGVPPAAVTGLLRTLMKTCPVADRDSRWGERYAEIGGLVSSAVAKFAPAPEAAGGTDREPYDPWERSTAPDFPVGCLPPRLRAVVEDDARRIGADLAAVAMAHLAVVAAAVDGATLVRVRRHDEWTENARIWVMLVGEPNSKKTPVIDAAVRPLRSAAQQAMDIYLLQRREWEEKPKDDRGPEPLPTRYILNDTTPEKAAEILATNPRGVLLHQDELAGWIGGMEKYSSAKGASANRAFWLQAYQGGHYVQDRVGRGTIPVKNLSVSILGGIQPGRLKKLGGDLSDDGLLQRFIPVLMGRAKPGEDRAPCAEQQAHREHIKALLTLTPRRLYLDEAGHKIREAAFRRFDDLASAEAIGSGFGGFVGKCGALMVRLALALHFAESASLTADDGLLPAKTVERAGQLMDFILRNAAAFYDDLGGGSGNEDTRALASFIIRWKQDEIKLRDFVRNVRCCQNQDERECLRKISFLAGAGWLVPANDKYPCRTWRIAGGVREHFATRAAAEAARCAKVVELIRTEADRRSGRDIEDREKRAAGQNVKKSA